MPAVRELAERGFWHQDQFPDNPVLGRGCTQDYMGTLQAYLPCELRRIVESAGMRVLRCGGLGTLANHIRPEACQVAMEDPKLFEEFLDLCEYFDRHLEPDGPGTAGRAGVIVVAEPAG